MNAVVPIIVLLITLVFWNWLGSIVASLVPAPIVLWALRRFNRDPDNVGKMQTYLRFLAASHLFNHAVTVVGSFLWIYFLFYRIPHIFDAGTRLIKADAMPAAADM